MDKCFCIILVDSHSLPSSTRRSGERSPFQSAIKINGPDGCADNPNGAQDLNLVMFDISDQAFEGRSKKIRTSPDSNGPDHSAHGIKKDEVSCGNRAHSDHKRGHGAKPVKKTEYEDKGGPESIGQPLGLLHTDLP